MKKENFKPVKNLSWILLGVWFFGVELAGYLGIFDGGSRYSMRVPLPLGLAAVMPVVAFGLWFRYSARFRDFVLSLNPSTLTAVHTWRVEGVTFLILLAKGVLSPVFAYPAGFGDIAIGITAPFIAYSLAQHRISSKAFILWQCAGIADLVIAVTTGTLSSPSPIGILAHGSTTTNPMGLLPLSLIPTFAVPLMVILHIICIAKARRETFVNRLLNREPIAHPTQSFQ